MSNPSVGSEGKAWPKGKYTCCNGDMTCANNRTKLLCDTFADKFAKDPDEARSDLWEAIANREEDAEMLGYRVTELKAESLRLTRELDMHIFSAKVSIDGRDTKIAELESELQRIQALPEEEWLKVATTILDILASAARSGYPVRETDAVKAFDRGQTYVARLKAQLAHLTKENEALRDFKVAEDIEQAKFHDAKIQHAYDQIAHLTRQTATMVEALNRIIDCIPACQGGSCFIEHRDMDGNFQGTEWVDPIAVIQSIDNLAREALKSHTTKQEEKL